MKLYVYKCKVTDCTVTVTVTFSQSFLISSNPRVRLRSSPRTVTRGETRCEPYVTLDGKGRM